MRQSFQEALSRANAGLAGEIRAHSFFTDAFSDPAIPIDPQRMKDGAERPAARSYTQSPREMSALAELAVLIMQEGVQIVTDFDGTVARFVKDAPMSAIDTACYEALLRIQAQSDSSVVFLTGREPHVLRPMISPGERTTFNASGTEIVHRANIGDIKNVRGATIVPENDRVVRFAIMGMHGTVSQGPDAADGTPAPVREIELTPEEQHFIQTSHEIGRMMEDRYPEIQVQYKARNGVDISAASLPDDLRDTAIAEARMLLAALVSGPLNPEIDGRRAFVVADESAIETCARNERLNKAWAMTGHGLVDPDKLTLFLCDSLGKDGTDAAAAVRINTEFPRGYVLHVLNDRDHCLPLPGTGQEPLATFASPAQLGRYLNVVATLKETRDLLMGPKPAAPKAFPGGAPSPG